MMLFLFNVQLRNKYDDDDYGCCTAVSRHYLLPRLPKFPKHTARQHAASNAHCQEFKRQSSFIEKTHLTRADRTLHQSSLVSNETVK